MRTTLDINAQLLKEAMIRTKAHTKRETVERALEELIRAARRKRLIALKGSGYGMSLRTFLSKRSDE
jgi:Arc/MetJ family transcription regulator